MEKGDSSKLRGMLPGYSSRVLPLLRPGLVIQGAEKTHLCHAEGGHSGDFARRVLLGGRGGCLLPECALFMGAGDEWQEMDGMVTCLQCVPSSKDESTPPEASEFKQP